MKNFFELLRFYQKYKLRIFPIIVVVSSLVLIIFVLYPQTAQLITGQKKQEELQSKTINLEAKAQKLESYDVDDLKRKVDYATYSFPTEKEIVSAFGLLQSLVTQTGFSIVSLNLGGSAKEGSAQGFNLKLDLIGSSSLVPLLLKDIEDSPRLMRVRNIETTSAASGAGANVSLNLSILYAAAPASFGAVDSPLPALSEKDEEVIARLTQVPLISPEASTQLGPRGKQNPFE